MEQKVALAEALPKPAMQTAAWGGGVATEGAGK